MAIIKKTVSGLKPDSNYLFAVKPKNTEISASDTIPDSIRIKTPASGSVPSTITSFNIYCNFESVMFVFQPVVDQDFAEYEYEIYDGDSATPNLVSTGKKRSTVFVISVPNTTSNVNPTTGVETVVYKKYYGRVRAINTSGNAGAWTSLATHSGNTPLIEDQYIGSLTAGKITTGLMTAEQVILQNASGTLQSYTPTAGMSVIRSSNFVTGPLGTGAGWIIRGDGTAEFDAASIRGTLSANSIFIDAYNRWARNSANSAGNLEFVVGNATNQLYWNPTGGTSSGSLLKVGNSTNYMQWDNNTLTVTGAITTSANISSSTAGGIAIGTSSLYFGANQFANANTPFYVDTSSRFSLGDKLYYEVAGGTTPTLTVNGVINASGGTFSGNINATGKIIGGQLIGATIKNADVASPTFQVDTFGNVFANNIYATGTVSDLGLQIRADGTGGSTLGAIWVLSASGKETKIGNKEGSLNIRYRAADGDIPEAVVLEPAWLDGATWKQTRNFEINLSSSSNPQYALYLNSDMVLRGGALTGSGNDIFSDTPTPTNVAPQDVVGTAIWRPVSNAKGTYVLARAQYSSSITIKENVSLFSDEESINIIKNLSPKKFTYKKEEKFDSDFSYKFKQLDSHYGFIAEEVKEKFPFLAIHDFTKEGLDKFKEGSISEQDVASDEYFQVINYKTNSILSIAVATIQNLLSRVEYLEEQLAAQ